jgi:hypothetical protein
MRHANNLIAGVASSAMRVVAIATDVARLNRPIAAVIRDSAANTVSQMNARQLQNVGLWPSRGSTLNDGYASAEVQLGMVR